MPARLATRTHPRGSGAGTQLLVLAVAAAAGCLLGLALLAADMTSWRGATTGVATVVGRSATGVVADSGGRQVVLHLPRVPAAGTRLEVEVSRDGRARPSSYRQTPGRALRSGVLLAVGLAVLVQAYRFVVTRGAGGSGPGRSAAV